MEPHRSALPAVVAHADWSLRPSKRQLCVATRRGDGWWIEAPRPVASLASPAQLPARLRAQADGGSVLLGLDAVLGLPRAWGVRAGVTDFRRFLEHTLGEPGWQEFWAPAARPEEISLRRPFYPRRPGGTRQQHLVDGLGVDAFSALRRRCDQPQPGSPTPCPLFWTLGANQVGKGTLTAWRELVRPALLDPDLDLRLWPFDGPLLAGAAGAVTLAEVYPGAVAAWLDLGLAARGGKRSQAARAAQIDPIRAALDRVHATASPALRARIEDGFGPGPTGEDAFDALLGVLGMLLCVGGHRPVDLPPDLPGRDLEGWVLGRAPHP